MKRCLALLLSLLILLSLCLTAHALGGFEAKKKKKATPTPAPYVEVTPAPAAAGVTPVPSGPLNQPQSIVDYLAKRGRLPDNFVTKKEAQKNGWDSRRNRLSDVLPGKSIGGDRFGNYEGILPTAKGRQYYECDCFYVSGSRNGCRLVYSNDGLYFYTGDHYVTFHEMHPGENRVIRGP